MSLRKRDRDSSKGVKDGMESDSSNDRYSEGPHEIDLLRQHQPLPKRPRRKPSSILDKTTTSMLRWISVCLARIVITLSGAWWIVSMNNPSHSSYIVCTFQIESNSKCYPGRVRVIFLFSFLKANSSFAPGVVSTNATLLVLLGSMIHGRWPISWQPLLEDTALCQAWTTFRGYSF